MRVTFVALILSVLLLSTDSKSQTVETPQLIKNVRVFDGERVFEHRSVLIENGKISRLSDASLKVRGAEIVNGRGRTLLPGFFDAHVHMPGKNGRRGAAGARAKANGSGG